MAEKLYQNEAWLREQYINQKKSCSLIASNFDICGGTIWLWLKKFNIPRRSFSETLVGNCNNPKGNFQKDNQLWKARRPQSEELKKARSERLKGNQLGKGHHQSEEVRRRISLAQMGEKGNGWGKTGDKNNNWRGGISFKPYCFKFNKNFKELIRDKFGRKCYLCPTTEKEIGKKLDVHHIDYNKNSICNGKEWAFLPLCKKCHLKTNVNRWYWFNLLIYYWVYKYIDFDSSWCLT